MLPLGRGGCQCRCCHFLAKTTLYFDQKKMLIWVSGQTKDIKIIQKPHRNARYYFCYLNKRLWLNHDDPTQSNRGNQSITNGT